MQTKVKTHVKWMIRRDLPEVMAIERDAFEFPWFEEDFIKCLRQRNCIGMVVENTKDGSVIGYMIYELHKTRLHLLNFAVHRDHWRQGVGSQMVDKLIGKLNYERRNKITVEVREANLPAQLFFRQMRFFATKLLRDFYDDSPEAAYFFEYEL